jgi:hypothetical protein
MAPDVIGAICQKFDLREDAATAIGSPQCAEHAANRAADRPTLCHLV